MPGQLKRWIYPDNRPNWIARVLNNFWRMIHSRGLAAEGWVTLEIVGRKSGRTIAFPIVTAFVEQDQYVVSMLGNNAQWVKNLKAADYTAHIRRGIRRQVRLEEVPVEDRAPIIKEYLQCAPGARPHIPVDKDAPLSEFEGIADQIPVYRIVS